MIVLALDLAIVAIVAFCVWRGYRNGLIRGVFGFVALIAAIVLANIASSAYSGELRETITPFVGGIVDSTLSKISDGEDDIDYRENDELFNGKSDEFVSAFRVLRNMGLPESAASRVAQIISDSSEEDETPPGYLSDLIADRLASVLASVLVFAVAFLLLTIVFAVVGNLISLVFSLPGLRLLDITAGMIFGLAKGLIIVFALAMVVRYVSLLAPETINNTTLLKYFMNNNLIANQIGV